MASERFEDEVRATATRLAELFSTSRAQVRDVLARLANEGIVDMVPNRGAFIASPTPEQTRERTRLLHNAPHLAQPLAFVMPSYHWWETPFYGIGLTLYDVLAGKAGFRLLHVANGRALIEDKAGMYLVRIGSILPDNSRVATLEQRDGKWVIVTSTGDIYQNN